MDQETLRAYDATRSFDDKAFKAACYAPSISMELDPRGQVFACCVNQLYPIGKVPESSLREIWDGRRAQNLRQAMRSYDFGSGCNVCRWHLEHGDTDPVAKSYEGWAVPDPDPAWPVRMTFALSNRCNLGCVMCNAELSSTIRVREGLPALPTVYDDAFFEELAEFLAHLEYAAFLGGEPFLIAENRRVWDLMDELGLRFPITITTNGTQWNDRVRAVIDRFPTSFNLSIDALDPEVLQRIRLGVDAPLVLANAERFRQHAADHGQAFGFMFCLMSENWDQLGPMLERAHQWDAQIQVINVSEPGLDLHALPTTQLEDVLAGLEAQEPELDLGPHAARWAAEMDQIRHTLAQRQGGIAVTIRQAEPVGAGQLAGASETPPHPPRVTERVRVALGRRLSRVDDAVARLRRWAPDGRVDVLELAADGRVRRADLQAGVLASDASMLLDRTVDELVEGYRAAQGADLWVIDRHDGAGVLDQTLIISPERPLRGAHGTIVRTVTVEDGRGATVLAVAADQYYAAEQPPARR